MGSSSSPTAKRARFTGSIPDSVRSRQQQDANGPQGLAYDGQGRLYICETTTRRLVRMDRRGTIEPVATSFEAEKFNSPRRRERSAKTARSISRIRHSPLRLTAASWILTVSFHVNGHGDVEALARWKTRPNGLTLSPDGKRLFVSDADRHAIRGVRSSIPKGRRHGAVACISSRESRRVCRPVPVWMRRATVIRPPPPDWRRSNWPRRETRFRTGLTKAARGVTHALLAARTLDISHVAGPRKGSL